MTNLTQVSSHPACHSNTQPRDWLCTAIQRIEADINRSADTHLIRVPLPALPGITLYLKDESSHPTGSLKHRLARSLFLYALCNGWIGPQTLVVEASSGSTAVSEAYFARLIGLDFVAVMPRTTSPEKIAAIEFQGGRCHLVDDPKTVYGEAAELARGAGGLYIDQFTFAERATDWRGNNNIAESIFSQMSQEPDPVPRWIVTGAGTGGTSATIGRYIRYQRHTTRLCVADPTESVFHRHYQDRSVLEVDRCRSVIEGIGRPRVEPSFIPEVVDRMITVPDTLSVASMRVISDMLGRRCGGSTGTNVYAALRLAEEMAAAGEQGSIVSILCDSGDRYASTLYDDAWLAGRGIGIAAPMAQLESFLTGKGSLPL
ncbi:PLP-dependent cysteine synthase family protein [Ancylobacter moscoviensis]|uniref:PLP-dependent cysteine synthase family protein n=1 Tax=Ancylobacter moscoviensis TaxID=2597768 RepID=UPI00164297F5|nr:PLP-dependent cysteine synthase family protein [Ancylobacter moscoviensis]